MLVYQYNPDGYYIGVDEADESPLEPGVFLVPASSTPEPPPEPQDGKIQRWNGSEWVLEDLPEIPPPPPATPEQVRAQRNGLLQVSDWTQLQDVPIANRSAWATYRQALRDVPAQEGFPENVTWPTPPNYTKT